MFRHLQVSRDGPVEHLVLNRPEVRNPFNDEVIAELTAWAGASATAGKGLKAFLAKTAPRWLRDS